MGAQAFPIKMLVIDDSADVRELVRATFRDNMWQLYFASDGEEGLELARQKKPAIALLDIVIPRLQGWNVCETLKGSRETDGIKVIMLSALIQSSHKRRAFQIGADAYIEKPFSPSHLIDTVIKVMQLA